MGGAGLQRPEGGVSRADQNAREQARGAATDYATLVARLGIDPDEALRIVQAALTRHATSTT
ncbi:hypothetical protein [Streptomyces sp. NPDC002057]|uniref:hypothetical protein n=1 Tax=Streptomyces sp. NPDC002057 TaxID=3154664 RepID=UPI00332059B7